MKTLSLIKFCFLLMVIGILGCHSNNKSSQIRNEQTDTTKQSDTKEAENYINEFFKKYQVEGTSKAVDYIFSSNLSIVDNSQLMNLKSKLDSTRQLIGNFDGQELITKKNTSRSFILYSYLAKHDKQPLRFTFIFYKPQNNWTLYKFKYDDQADSELEESGKIYFIK